MKDLSKQKSSKIVGNPTTTTKKKQIGKNKEFSRTENWTNKRG